jgi:coenzyme F420 hydrogenase subunit beta
MPAAGSPNPLNVSTTIVPRDLCIGCGVCVPICPAKTLEMAFNLRGQFVPADHGACRKGCHLCLDACPFLDQEDNEDSLAKTLFANAAGVRHRTETGYYLGLHVGHAPEFRSSSTSGGLGRWLLGRLFTENLIDAAVCVRDTNNPEQCFEYAVFHDAAEVYGASRSAYYPVEMSAVLEYVLRNEGRYVVVGVPCFLKGLRLAMRQNQWLRSRVAFTVGLVCSESKSKFFHEFLLRQLGMHPGKREWSVFRFKGPDGRLASDYVFRASDGQGPREVSFLGTAYGQAYNSGQFKPRACTFCDDVFAEVADVALMDAWLPQFIQQREGTSIVLTRRPEVEALLARGKAGGDLDLERICIDDVVESQAPAVYNKRRQLAYRLWLAIEQGITPPAKRVPPAKPSVIERRLQKAGEQLRNWSFEAMLQQQAAGEGLAVFHQLLAPALRRYQWCLRLSRRVDVYLQALKRRWRLFRSTGSFGPLPFRRRSDTMTSQPPV